MQRYNCNFVCICNKGWRICSRSVHRHTNRDWYGVGCAVFKNGLKNNPHTDLDTTLAIRRNISQNRAGVADVGIGQVVQLGK